MSFFRKRLTEVAVDSFSDYLKEKVAQIKTLDLDKDGVKDVDQMLAILENCTNLTKQAVATMNFQQIAAGAEQIMDGLHQVSSAVDREALKAVSIELGKGLHKLGDLAQLGIHEVRTKGTLLNDEP